MKYVLCPDKAKKMLEMCLEGNHIYEVTKRFSDGSVGWSLAQAQTPEEAEALALELSWCKSAVARQIVVE